MAPPPADPNAAAGGAAPGGMPPEAMPPEAMPPEAMPKAAGWWEDEAPKPASYIGRPIANNELHVRAAALQALRRSLGTDAD